MVVGVGIVIVVVGAAMDVGIVIIAIVVVADIVSHCDGCRGMDIDTVMVMVVVAEEH